MNYLPATSEFGLIVRKAALDKKGISRSMLDTIMTDIHLIGESEDLLSYGPMFGMESLDEIIFRLQNIGLIYVDDFVELNFLVPNWVKLGIASAS